MDDTACFLRSKKHSEAWFIFDFSISGRLGLPAFKYSSRAENGLVDVTRHSRLVLAGLSPGTRKESIYSGTSFIRGAACIGPSKVMLRGQTLSVGG